MADQDLLLWEHHDPKSTYMWEFMTMVNRKYGQQLGSYKELHAWSVENVAEFWGEVWDFTRVKGTPYTQVSRPP
jgi:acetoacetyl-CoA synthetase